MTGPEHYREAERLLSDASFSTTANGLPCTRDGHLLSLEEIMAMRAAAQVHATLALAAATALGSMRVDDHGMPPDDGNLWLQAASCTDWVHDD